MGLLDFAIVAGELLITKMVVDGVTRVAREIEKIPNPQYNNG